MIWSACCAARRRSSACAPSRSAAASPAHCAQSPAAPKEGRTPDRPGTAAATTRPAARIARPAPVVKLRSRVRSGRHADQPADQVRGEVAAAPRSVPDRTTSLPPGPCNPASTCAARRGRRTSPSNRLFSSITSVARPATSAQSSPSVSIRSAVALNATRLSSDAGIASSRPVAVGEAAERVVVMHHRLAVGADLQIAFDRVVAGDRGLEGGRRVLDHAVCGVMQAPVGDRCARSASPGMDRLFGVSFSSPRTRPRPRPRHRAAAPKRRSWCGHGGPCRRTR